MCTCIFILCVYMPYHHRNLLILWFVFIIVVKSVKKPLVGSICTLTAYVRNVHPYHFRYILRWYR